LTGSGRPASCLAQGSAFANVDYPLWVANTGLQLDIPFDTRHDANMKSFILKPSLVFCWRYGPA
jgi:hypothetical protein